MSTPPPGGSLNGAPPRYNVQPVPHDKHVIADTLNMGTKPRVYVLSYRRLVPGTDAGNSFSNWVAELGYIDVAGKTTLDTQNLESEVLIWSCPMYAAHKLVREETAKQILDVFSDGFLEIDHPYELMYRFGGTVHNPPLEV